MFKDTNTRLNKKKACGYFVQEQSKANAGKQKIKKYDYESTIEKMAREITEPWRTKPKQSRANAALFDRIL